MRGGFSVGIERARQLRRNHTEAERRVWARLRARQLNGVKFRRQHPVGSFVVDFCCPERRVIVELDGGQHASRVLEDQRRTTFLVQRGYRVLRFWDNDVITHIEAVIEQIANAVSDPHPSPLPDRDCVVIQGPGERSYFPEGFYP